MACRSHHPFLHYLISRVVQRSPYITRTARTLRETIGFTGPAMLSWTYAYYRRSIPQHLRLTRPGVDVICPESDWFLPTSDITRVDKVKKRCKGRLSSKEKEICKKFAARKFSNVPLNFSYTTHHWFHSYHYNVSKTRVNINSLFKPIKWPINQYKLFDISYG